MIRLSVTDLDSYRWWKSSEDAELDALLRRLRREEPPTVAMQAGRAFHKMLELAKVGDIDVATIDGFTFRFELSDEIAIAPIRELKGEILLDTPAGPVTLVGVVDGLHALKVRDYKLTERFDAERYADSYQWRCYLEMFGGNEFVYDVFVYSIDNRDGTYVVRDYIPMSFFAYPEMRKDIIVQVTELAEIVKRYVPELIKDDADVPVVAESE